MAKVLVIDYEKCEGCRECEMVCSAKHEGLVNPYLSRIKVIKWPVKMGSVPIACAQCELAPCHAICPVNAISRDEELRREMVDHNICIGCRMCIAACPFGCMNFDSMGKKVFKCDLCDGDPICVRNCAYDALQYADASEQSAIKQRAVAGKLPGIMRKMVEAMATGE